MRTFSAVSCVCGTLIATSAFASDWQAIWKRDDGKETVSIDKQSLKKMTASVRVSIKFNYSEVKEQKAGSSIPNHDMTVGEYVINCRDYTSTINRNTWYLDSKTVKVFNGPSNPLPAPPQFETGVPAAFKA